MLTKMLGIRLPVAGLVRAPCCVPAQLTAVKRWSDMIPPDQYDCIHNEWPKKFKVMHAMTYHWEVIPLFFVTATAMALMVGSIFWALKNKVDVVLSSSHSSRESLSRTMDLRNPSVHKIIIINQRYLPWPEMQDVQDKMAAAERKAKSRLESCATP